MNQEREQNIPVTIVEDKMNKDKSAPENQENNYLESLQRLQADFDNYRKRNEREKQDLADFVRGNFIQELLPVLDDFDRFLQSASNEEDLRQGAQLIFSNLLKIFEKYGLRSFDDVGKPFDPNIHEAVGVKPVSPELVGKIIETWQKGYWLKDRLLRPAKVIVGSSKDEEQSD